MKKLWIQTILILFLFWMGSACSVYQLCPIPNCQVRMLHAHNGVTFRGQPWWRPKKLNPKVGDSYVYTKDQNLIKKEYWWNKKKKKEEDKKKTGQLAGIKARDPSKRKKEKDLDVEPQEEDKDEKDSY